MIRTLIVDDNPGFLQQLRDFLNTCENIEVISEAVDGEQAITLVMEKKPELVLMDVRLNDINGLEATRRIKDISPETVVIMLSNYDFQEYRDAAAVRGAAGYVVKKQMGEDLCPTIKRVMRSARQLVGQGK